jgi:hypothetical protein
MIAGIFVVGIIVAIAVFDIWIIWRDGKQASVSAWIIRYSKNYPIFPFLLGVAMGHLFWSMSDFDWMLTEDVVKACETYLKMNP